MVRQRRVNISHEFTTGMAGVINQFTHQQNAALEEQKAKYHKYIKRLKKDLSQESAVVARQVSEIDAQSKDLEALQESKEHMASQLRDIKAKLRASDDHARKLEEKYHACKTHLNSAIQEQQDLYTRSKEQWDEALRQVRAMGKSQSVETEMAVQKAEVIREKMIEKVRQTIAQSKSEAMDLYGRIETLTQQVEEKETELMEERESVRTLSKRVRELQATSAGFEALAAQGKQILATIGEQQSKAEEHRQKLAEDFRHRITAKLDTILDSRNSISEATGQLSADLELHTEKIWKRLDDQLESLSKQLAEKAEENGMVSTLYKRKDAECEQHKKAIESLRETAEKQCDQIQDLEASLVSLDAAQEENEDTIRRLQATARDTTQLREDLEAKAAAVAELQIKLDVKEREHASELQSYSSNIHKLAQAIHEKDQSLGAAVQQAAETARREARAEMEKPEIRQSS
ncbi:hypothetical protein NEMBOFW57_008399 [Staphylotrichum longicolle]|uniref:Uncharacterized protein n=1 Tax=Staphylotrichum longicolle TaxID=669026 RepID=A0AAD4HWL5_9PEZI|nr:hypothetical protein NEMBOFW57_008399 [Staphylotrichum longicolle]